MRISKAISKNFSKLENALETERDFVFFGNKILLQKQITTIYTWISIMEYKSLCSQNNWLDDQFQWMALKNIKKRKPTNT